MWSNISFYIRKHVTSSVIGLACEGISSFLHHKRHKALQKAVAMMNKKTNIQRNRIHHLVGHHDYVWHLQFGHFERPYRHGK